MMLCPSHYLPPLTAVLGRDLPQQRRQALLAQRWPREPGTPRDLIGLGLIGDHQIAMLVVTLQDTPSLALRQLDFHLGFRLGQCI